MKNNKGTIVSYKEKMKSSDPFDRILIRVLIIKDVLNGGSIASIASKHRTYRSTIYDIMKVFHNRLDECKQSMLQEKNYFNKKEIIHYFSELDKKSTKPNRHSKMATKEQEQKIIEIHRYLGFGASRLITHIKRLLSGSDKRLKKVKEVNI